MEIKTQGTDLRTQWGKERVGRVARAAWEHALQCGEERPAGICCVTPGAQTSAPRQPQGIGRQGGGRRFRREYA